MSLFVGNISKNVSTKEFESAFNEFGKCKIEFKHRFAFVKFESEGDAEQARSKLKDKEFAGLPINIEWSKNSGKYDDKDSKRPNRSRSRSSSYRRDRKSKRKRSHSDSRSRSKDRHRDNKHRYRSRDRNRSHDKSKDRS